MPFQKGNSGGPGRPKKSVEEKYRNILVTRVTANDWKRIVERAVEQAIIGDKNARKWLGDHLLGLPVQRQEVTGADGAPLSVIVVDK